MSRTGYRMHPVRTPLSRRAAVCTGLAAVPPLVAAYQTSVGGLHPVWFWPSASMAALAAVYPVPEPGFDSPLGAVVGGLIVGVAESLTIQYVDFLDGIELIVPFALILVVLLVRPNGLFGRRIVERV